jgi:hypothetical protein
LRPRLTAPLIVADEQLACGGTKLAENRQTFVETPCERAAPHRRAIPSITRLPVVVMYQ